ncbi:MAG TPA: ABC transporter substrate-binding protein [Alphaproteobacteria bacterium]|nr:ABC transporter substrate-binding protein [Alphaproteobacteria bacterium]
MFRSVISGLAALVALAGLAAPAAAADNAEWQIGLVKETSGPLKEVGDSTSIAAKLAVSDINAAGGIAGKKIHLIEYDTAGDPKQASVAVRALAQDKNALAIVGPLSSAETAVAANDAERLHILMLPYSSSAPGITDGKTFTWRLSATEDQQFARVIKALRRKNLALKKVDILYTSDDKISNITGSKVFPPLLNQAGIEVPRSVTMTYNSFDVSPQIAQVMQDKPDAIALAANFDQAVTVMKELRRQNFKGRVIGSQIFSDPNLAGMFGKDADGMIFASGFWRYENDKTKKFADRFVQEMASHGIKKVGPHHVDAQAYDTVYLLKSAIERSHVTGDPAKLDTERVAVRDAMKGMIFSGVLGDNICFVENNAQLPGYIIEVKGGQWTLFDQFPPDSCKKS